MFTTAQLDLMRPLIAEMRDKGYSYYLAYQNLNTGTSYDFDLLIYFSKEEIFAPDLYRYTIPKDSLLYSLRTGNYSTNNYYPRTVVSNVESIIVKLDIPVYSHISTNAVFTNSTVVQPDLFLEVKDNEYSGALVLIACVFLFVYSFVHLFRR